MKTMDEMVSVRPLPPESRAHIRGLVAVLVLAAVLRLYQLGSESLWIDEGFSLRDARLADLMHETRPLYFFILSEWLKLGALRSEFLLRLPSAVFGIMGVWMLYAVGRRLFNPGVAVLASFFMAISVLQVNHSQETRWYSMLALLSLAATYCLVRYLQDGRAGFLAGYTAFALATLMTFPLAVFVLAAHGIFLLLYARAFERARYAIVALILVAGAWTPWLFNSIATASSYSEGYTTLIEKPTPINTLAMMGRLFLYKWSDPGRMQALGALFFSLVVVLLALRALNGWSRTNARLILVWLWLVIPLGATIITSYEVANVWRPSYLIAASPAFYLLVAQGVRSFRSRCVAVGCAAFIAVLTLGRLGVYYLKPNHPQWREVIAHIGENERPGDVIGVYSGGNQHVFRYYYHGASRWSPLDGDRATSEHWSGWNPDRVRALFAGYPYEGKRFRLVLASHTYAGGFHMINYIKARYRILEHKSYFEVETYLFDARGRPVPTE